MEFISFPITVDSDGKIRATYGEAVYEGVFKGDDLKGLESEIFCCFENLRKEGREKDIGIKHLQTYGDLLFSTLFTDKIKIKYYELLSKVKNTSGQVIRLRLAFQKQEWADLPWELLYDKKNMAFLASDEKIALSRDITTTEATPSENKTFPIRILLIVSSPSDLIDEKNPINADEEEELFKQALKKYGWMGKIKIESMTDATYEKIEERLRSNKKESKQFHIIRFIGHGRLKSGKHVTKGEIALLNDNQKAEWVDEDRFTDLFIDIGLGLVVLNVRHEATQEATNDAFVAMARSFSNKKIPAAIVMQYPVDKSTAQLFADTFYRNLARSKPVDEATQSSRREVTKRKGIRALDFATPVLYMNKEDGRILDLPILPRRIGAMILIALIAIASLTYMLISTPPSDSQLIERWNTSIVDNRGMVGAYASIAMDSSNKVHISYYDVEEKDLKYATNAGGSWNIITVDSEGSVGQNSSIDCDSLNHVHISYYDELNEDLKYATNAGGSWINTTIDSEGSYGRFSAIVLDSNDVVHIAYYDYSKVSEDHTALKYINNQGGVWNSTIVDSTGYVGKWTCIAIDTLDKVHISYYDEIGKDLKYATNAGGSWSHELVDSAGYVGQYAYSSIDCDSLNHAHISYYDDLDKDLRYATNAGGGWTITIVDSEGHVGRYSSIVVDPLDKVHISYSDSTNKYLKYATNAGGSWTTTLVDTRRDVGAYSSIAMDSMNNMHISYYDITNTNLKYATNVK